MTYNLLEVDETRGKLQQFALSSQILNIMADGRLKFVVEDRFRLSRDQGYWCRFWEPGMQAYQVIVTTSPSTEVYILVNFLYHFILCYGSPSIGFYRGFCAFTNYP